MGKPMCGKEGKNLWLWWRMIHSSNLWFNFNFMMFFCLFERPISPKASMGFKILEIDAIVGRLCQIFYKNLRRKLQQHKQALITS